MHIKEVDVRFHSFILNVGTKWRRVVNFLALVDLTPGQDCQKHTEEEAG